MTTLPNLPAKTPVFADLVYGAQDPFASGDDAKFTVKQLDTVITGTNVIHVESMDDFPAAVAGVRTLTSGVYVLHTALTTSDRFVIGTSEAVTFRGVDAGIAGFIYTGSSNFISAGDFISFSLVEMFYSGGAGDTFFNVTNATAKASRLFMVNFAIIDCDDLGLIEEIDAVAMTFSSFQNCGQGLTLNNVDTCFMVDSESVKWKDEVSTMFSHQGTATSVVYNGFTFRTKTNESIFDFDSGFTADTVTIAGNTNSNSAGGSVYAAGSLTQTTPFITVGANSNITRSEALAFMSVQGNSSETVISIINTPVIVNATWTEGINQRFTFSSAGRYTYTGLELEDFIVDATATVNNVGGGSDIISIYVAKNGTICSETKSSASINSEGILTIDGLVQLVTGDYLELFIENNSDTSNIVVSDSTFRIKD